MSELALLGGRPIRTDKKWPAWPQYDDCTEKSLLEALHSRRWAVSWPATRGRSRERQFAEAFAQYNNVSYGVSVDHGSSALVVSLEALNIGPGDEVIVPVMTWVAPVAAVLRVGALPVVADVDPETGCLTADSIHMLASERTRAVILVHLAATVGDLDAVTRVCEELGLNLIEDCAQAHGAEWNGRKVGCFGDLGCFSFQVGKVLACGEGGAVITSDESLYHRVQLLRADSRRYVDGEILPGGLELLEDGTVMGGNYCMSELSAALLLDQLPRLDGQHRARAANAEVLEEELRYLGMGPIPTSPQVTKRSFYEYGIRFLPGAFGGAPVDRVAEAVGKELGMAVWAPDLPLHRSVMLHPHTKRRFSREWDDAGRRRALGREFPGAEAYRASTLLFHHKELLGDAQDMQDIAAAVRKVAAEAHLL